MHRDVVTVHPGDAVERLLRLMREHELPGVPVVDDAGRLVTEADPVIRDEDADLHLPHHIDQWGGIIFLEPIKHYEDRRRAYAADVADRMTLDPLTVRPDDTVRSAAHIIAERRHNRLPVVDQDGRLVGVVTRVHVLDVLVR